MQHQTLCWQAEEENARRLRNRFHLNVIQIAAFLALSLAKFLGAEPGARQLDQLPLVVQVGLLLSAATLFTALVLMFFTGDGRSPLASEKLSLGDPLRMALTAESDQAALAEVLGRLGAAHEDLLLKNIEESRRIDRSQRLLLVAAALALGALLASAATLEAVLTFTMILLTGAFAWLVSRKG